MRIHSRTAAVLALALLAGAPAAFAQSWTNVGPAPMTGFAGAAGRVSAVVCHPTNPNRYYAGGADGGVWRTDDGGATWTPLTDLMPTTAIGALALDPTNPSIVYAGTGEANFANHSRPGAGLYKSTDGGDTWAVLGSETFSGRCFSRIVINPLNPQIVYASITQPGGFPALAAAKNHPGATGPRGVFRSLDGGQTWNRLAGLPDLCATDITIDPLNPFVVYAAIGHIFGNAANGIYKSEDGGENWVRLQGGLPTTLIGRISMSVAPSQPGTVYALITRQADATGGGASALGGFRSIDSGQTWTSMGSAPDQSTYGWFLSVVAVHPTQPENVFVGGLNLLRRNVGGSWSTVTPPHVDQHAIAFDAQGRVIAGCDGGVYRSTDLGGSWTSLNTGLSTVQFYPGLSTHPVTAEAMLGGAQDNGTNRRATNSLTWTSVLGGDGGWTQINQANPQVAFGEFQGTANLYRSTNGGVSFTASGSGLSGDNCFLPPYLIDPANPNRMLFATERVFQSTSGGTSWTALSPDLTAGGTAAIRAIAIAPSDSNYVYAATNDGRLQSSTNAGATFTLRLTDGTNYPRVTRELTVDPVDPLTVYHARWTYGPAPRLRRSRDGGATWEPLDANLPDVPMNVVAIDPRTPLPTIFVGAEDGIYRTKNDGMSWRRYGPNFPRTAVTDLILETGRDRLVAGTMGRGAWTIPVTYCYADIDDDGLLTVADFTRFLQAFATGSGLANCDSSTAAPTLNVADFACFLQRFAEGCPQ